MLLSFCSGNIDTRVAGLGTHKSLRTPSLVFPSAPSVCFIHVLEDQLSFKRKDEKREETPLLGEYAYYLPQKLSLQKAMVMTKRGTHSKERVGNSLG